MQQSLALGPGGHRWGLPAPWSLCSRQCLLCLTVPAFSTLETPSAAGSFEEEVAVVGRDVKMSDSLSVTSICTFRIIVYDQSI